MPLRHIVLLKFKYGIDKAAAGAALSAGLEAMGKEIPEIASFSCGADAGLDPDRNHDFAILAEFADEAAYKVYATHPKHVELIGSLSARGSRTVYDNNRPHTCGHPGAAALTVSPRAATVKPVLAAGGRVAVQHQFQAAL